MTHNDWRQNAKRAILFLGDEGMEGGDDVDAEDIAAANKAIEVAKASNTRVHTYLAKSGAKEKTRKANQAEFARVAAETGGKAFTHEDTMQGFQELLEEVICASKQPTQPVVEDCKCCKERMERKVAASGAMKP